MTKHKKIIGTGITKREVISYSGEDMCAGFGAFANQWNAARSEGGGSFGAVVLSAERACRSILTVAGPPPFGADSAEDYARRILHLIEVAKTHITRGDADEAARTAVDIGRLCTEAHIKQVWEKHALRGEKNASRLKAAAARANEEKRDRARSCDAEQQAMADAMRAANPYLSAAEVGRRLANKVGGNPDTIRRKIKRK